MKVLFCDWNGTLLNDTSIWNEAMRETFLAFGKEPPTIREYFQELENGDYFGVCRRRGIDAPREKWNALYKPAYLARMHRAKLSAGAKGALLRLKKRGVCLVLLTAQIEGLVAPLLNKFSLRTLFDEYFFNGFDKRAIIERFMIRFNMRPADCFLVGDAPSDMRHAKQAGVVAIGFLNVSNSETSMGAAGADYCIHKFPELESMI